MPVLDDPPELDPKTVEVWLGVRRLDSMTSELYVLVEDLRSNLTGLSGYQDDAVASASSFDGLESSLKSTYQDVPEYDDSDIEATITTLEDAMSWSTYSGDSSNTWDGYRSFLTSNGVSSVDADRNIQLLQAWFDPSYTVHTDRDQIGSFADWETYVSNAGLASGDASTFRTKLESIYTDFAEFDSDALQTDDPLSKILNRAPHDPDPTGGEGLGLKIWEQSGTTPSGMAASPGDVSVRTGGRIYLEKAPYNAPADSDQATLSWGTTSADDLLLSGTDSTTVSATVDNTGTEAATITVPIVVDGTVETTRGPVEIPAGGSRTVSWTFGAPRFDYGSYAIAVGEADPVVISIAPGGIA